MDAQGLRPVRRVCAERAERVHSLKRCGDIGQLTQLSNISDLAQTPIAARRELRLAPAMQTLTPGANELDFCPT